jgi:flavoprotein
VEEFGVGARLNTFKEIKDVIKKGREISIFLIPTKEKIGRVSLKLGNAVLFCCKKCSILNNFPSPGIGQKIMEADERTFVQCLVCRGNECAINKKGVYKVRSQKKKRKI